MAMLKLDQVEALVQGELVEGIRSSGAASEQDMRALIERYAVLADASPDDVQAIFDRMRERHGVIMEFGDALVGEDFTPWFDLRRERETDWFYWNRYREYLSKGGFPGPVLAAMHEKTNAVIRVCGDPRSNDPFDRRGMVMGDVQAGKTGNYTALVGKAADVGYRVIIIIAGIHNNLRSQTQKRIDEGLIGRNSDLGPTETGGGSSRIGVGLLDGSRLPSSLTSRTFDFRKGQTSQTIPLKNMDREPVILVIKKNASTLKSLIGWLRHHNLSPGVDAIDSPMILIDDEADNASINVAKGADEVSRINGQIRDLLGLFRQSSYIAFTATPFANIFIDPDVEHEEAGRDLFPSDFLVALDRPGNYFGASKVFLGGKDGQDPDPKRGIEDNDPLIPLKMKKGFKVDELPGSLMTAIRTFLVAGAIRRLRGQEGKHHSMLVNVSYLTNVQKDVANLIRHKMDDLIGPALRGNCHLPPEEAGRNPEVARCRAVFEEEFPDVAEGWEDVLPLLDTVVTRTRVYEVNSSSGEKLDYPDVEDPENDQVTAIAVGGYSLSRGLTLEGLTVSYFLRNSKAYDTLLQMARWFGYRPGYEGLCRIWIKDDAADWYAHIAEASEDLRQDLANMAANDATPRDFGLRVRSHPSALEITARNKAGKGEIVSVEVGLQKSRIETTILHDNGPGGEAERNREAVIALQRKLETAGLDAREEGASRVHADVPSSMVKEFLGNYRPHRDDAPIQLDPILRYIDEREDENLDLWDVAFVGSSDSEAASDTWNALGYPLPMQRRTPRSREGGRVEATSRRFSSRGVVRMGMSAGQIEAVKAEAGQSNISDARYLARRTRPLLAIHVLRLLERDPDGEKGDRLPVPGDPLVAWTIGFPSSDRPEKTVTYRVNTTWWRQNRDEVDEEVAEELERDG